uniref:Uncharacterized protein n=1 Tax=Chromera velia CCMP2878 TaxID=1169474 RepID=A0A0G4G0V1_9ALVE|eukprot:Cvel_19588.t1-p1 / transcript=Cvel_19588.t1 / gene=Cvel_19588 / organism=Chromera_velia_CCMP2878 / gene_product=hypothetical protein / transcript_product=hypothetical protein / location=Cvel_scaffold1701:36727-39576(-) / protein_length=107 / sequence_SO=supercontig / SO=protein_coding / is_pseudo=false
MAGEEKRGGGEEERREKRRVEDPERRGKERRGEKGLSYPSPFDDGYIDGFEIAFGIMRFLYIIYLIEAFAYSRVCKALRNLSPSREIAMRLNSVRVSPPSIHNHVEC